MDSSGLFSTTGGQERHQPGAPEQQPGAPDQQPGAPDQRTGPPGQRPGSTRPATTEEALADAAENHVFFLSWFLVLNYCAC
jgi:hypothetical protein